MWCRFQQFLGTFTMLLVEGFSQTRPFRHLSNHISESVISQIQKLWGSSFFSKYSKFQLDFKKEGKILRKMLCFSDNCIWNCTVKLSLLRSGYFSLGDNVLTSSPKIGHVNKRDFFEHNALVSDQWIWIRSCDADFSCVLARWPYCLSKHPLKRDFLDIYLNTFSESNYLQLSIMQLSQ